MPIRLIIYVVLSVIVLGAVGGVWYKIYNSGRQAVITEQQKKLDKLKDKTNAAKTDALTTDDPAGQLREFARPDK